MFSPTLFTSVINSYLPEPHASLLNGILFGVDLHATKLFYQELRTVGLVHIVVLSGMNITLLGAIVMNITSFFSRRVSIMITILIIILFVLFVGIQAPVVRAAVMGMLTLVAFIFGRKNVVLFSLFLSGIFIFIVWPEWLSSISFQLSYGATLGIILFSGKRQIEGESNWEKVKIAIKKDLRTSLSAQVFAAPIIFFYFQQVSLISPLSNLLVSITIAPLMIMGFITAFLGKIHPFLGLIPSYICYGILSYVIFVVKTLAKVPYASISF
ncbi:hypothetical protein A2866_02330 [Candidatus Roizmanbacteria bacterium RIFCSPHIGHO2_01_FULL_39_8]|uniref:ComEC/Rec2-related protein domain-containing protein n=2 Tax=Candidatus Roizmaniibacteriota TaxID=1752723 RepID=A0A1F7GSG9_9BACT|nr:MAG: hypothetical protein A2866_02330 [Candidatus Roizmanbacteria bacterium RIFCSPHIGHO2_01_FULL_39_8]OGK37150.1 MAG: hypothetical protein A3F60_04525 [Candidatus Roizmanbacteria bacterium RIFCSPHIGHO2_12_FULL_39_8]